MYLHTPKRIIGTFFMPICVLISSCAKNRDNTGPNQEPKTDLMSVIENYYKLATTKADGKFIFESNLCNNDPSLTDIATTIGVFYDKQGNVVNSGGTVSIGNLSLSNHNGTFYIDKPLSQRGLYGTNVTFTIQPANDSANRSAAGAAAATATLYSPAAISITNIQPRTPLILKPNVSTNITWNTDPNNPNGVVLWLNIYQAVLQIEW